MTHDSLLSIDVDAEIDKLSSQWLQNAADAGPELVRALFRFGATSVQLDFGPQGLVARGPGAALSSEVLAAWERLRDGGAPPAARHAALVTWEQHCGLGSLAAMWQGELVVGRGGMKLRLPWPRGRRHELLQALRLACRFSRRPVTLGARRLDGGHLLAGALAQGELGAGVGRGVVALPRSGELGKLVLVSDEIVASEVVLQPRQGVAFLAVVEAGTAANERALAQAAEGRACDLLEELLRRFFELDPRARTAVRALVFARCRRTDCSAWMAEAPLFVTAGGRRLSLQALLTAEAAWQTTTARGVRLGHAPREALVLSLEERELLTWAGVHLLSPPPRLRNLWRRFGAFVRQLWPARGVAPPAADAVRDLCRTMAAHLEQQRFVLSQHHAPVRLVLSRRGSVPLKITQRDGTTLARVPVLHPRVREAALALERDPRAIYWILPALFGGEDGWGEHKRAMRGAWLARGP